MAQAEYIAPIRIEKIELKNFKGVNNGCIEFNCLKKPIEKETTCDMLGVYGQNGSGKSTLVEALHILKIAMMGETIPEDRFANIISQNAKKAEMAVTFQVRNQDDSFYHIEYRFSLENKTLSIKKDDIINSKLATELGVGIGAGLSAGLGAGAMLGAGIVGAPVVAPIIAATALGTIASSATKKSKKIKESKSNTKTIRRLVLSDEVLSLSGSFKGIETRFGAVFDTGVEESDEETVFLPKAKQKQFFPHDTVLTLKELKKYKKRYRYNSKSFIFSDELCEMLLDQKNSEYAEIILGLRRFARSKFRVLDSKILGVTYNNVIPIYTATQGVAIRKTDSSVFLDDEGIEILKTALEGINVALNCLIPGLKLESVKQMGVDVANGKRQPEDELGYTVTVYSVRNGARIPIAEESSGIIRLITVLGQFTYALNNDDITLVIDEVDSGIYEYLLGELLSIFEKNGLGQLVFTCHNLRPLELLDKKYIYFTTTNAENRYLKPKSIRKENNLRDVYLREIKNSGQDEDLYDDEKHEKIVAALQKAGEMIGEE